MSRLTETFLRIIELSKTLVEKADWWYCKCNEPVSLQEIDNHCSEKNVDIPDCIKELFSVSNGFTVDFCSTVGYFHMYPFVNCSPEGTGSSAYIPKQKTVGWVNHQCLYVDMKTGELTIEHERYHYTPVKDFCSEILEPVEDFLKKQLELSERKAELLENQRNNPFREYYDKLVSFNKDKTNVTIYPPVTEDEISAYEQKYSIKLPEDYRNWILLSNGTSFNGFNVTKLENISYFLDKTYEYENENYIYLVSLTGCCDYLMGGLKSGRAMVLTEEYEWEDGEEMFEEYLKDAIEWYEEDILYGEEE